MHLHTIEDLDHDLSLFNETEWPAICDACGQPVDEHGIASGRHPRPCFYCSGEDA